MLCQSRFEILLMKSLWAAISSGFRRGTLELARGDFSCCRWDPGAVSSGVLVKLNPPRLGLSDGCRGAAPEVSRVLPHLRGIPLLPLRSSLGACRAVWTDGSCSGHQASPSPWGFKKYLCLTRRRQWRMQAEGRVCVDNSCWTGRRAGKPSWRAQRSSRSVGWFYEFFQSSVNAQLCVT